MVKILTMALGLILVACDVTYIADSADPRLPYFSNTGRNAAGAYLNDVPWRASCGPSFTCNVEGVNYIESGDYTEFRLPRAAVRYDDVAEDASTTYLTMVFRMRGNQTETIKNLRSSDVLTFALDGVVNTVDMNLDQSGGTSDISTSNGVGQLHFRHAEVLDSGKYIISGTFGFEVNDQTGYFKVRSGRFDFRFTI